MTVVPTSIRPDQSLVDSLAQLRETECVHRKFAAPSADPDTARLLTYAVRRHLPAGSADVRDYQGDLPNLVHALEELTRVPSTPGRPRFGKRDPGRRPSPEEDPYNALIRFCDVHGAPGGPLAGMRIGVKDNIAVAGVPLTGGQRPVLPVPAEDAAVVDRILAAGARVTAKTNLNVGAVEFGMTRNPRAPRFHAGGSSSGSAAAVACGLVDAALGHDSGGSTRIPAAWCGVVGMKATHGLVSSHGLLHWDHTLDSIGPVTACVRDNAVMLETMAGSDWRDSTMLPVPVRAGDYTGAENSGVAGLRIGVVTESLADAGCTEAVYAGFIDAVAALAAQGADISPTSLPLWGAGPALWLATVADGPAATVESFGRGYGHVYRTELDQVAAMAERYWRGDAFLPFALRPLAMLAEHLREEHHGVLQAHAQNLRLDLRRQISQALEDFDLLLTPTTPTGPTDLRAQASQRGTVLKPWLRNTCQLNLTGHPALTVPAGAGESGLPAGLQIIGRHYDERTVYRAGFACERSFPPRPVVTRR